MSLEVTNEQRKLFLKFMTTHPNLAKGYYKGTKTEQNKLWKELALTLSAHGPPVKNVSGWKEYWLDWRNDIKTKIVKNRCGHENFQQNYLSPIENQLAILGDIFADVDYRVPGAKCFGLPDFESLLSASPTRKPLSTLVPDNFSNHSHASSSHTMSTLSPNSEVSSETKRKRSQSKENHNNEQQVHDTNKLQYVANEIKEIKVTLENHSKQLKNINTTLEEMCSLKKQEFEETKRHHLALEKIAMEKAIKQECRN